MRPELTAERLRELLHYDPETGVFTRLKSSGRWKAGTISGTYKDRHGYPSHKIAGHLYRAHRLAWLYVHGVWPDGDVDHINGVRCDNRLANLRVVSRGVNLQNRREAMSHSMIGLLGVSKDGKPNSKGVQRYRARIVVEGRLYNLYGFTSAEEAHQAYLVAKRKLHPGCTI